MRDEWLMCDNNIVPIKPVEPEEEMKERKDLTQKQSKEKDKDTEKEREEQEQLIRDYQEQIRRTQADFENYKRRTEERMGSFIEEANSQLIALLLPVLDSFELALQSPTEHNDIKAVFEGIKMIYRQFLEVLERAGVSKITAEGNPFDPEKHEAVSYEESIEAPPLHVLLELRTGYLLKTKVIRPTLVKVAKEPQILNDKGGS